MLSWSGGKDSALALWNLERRGVEVVELLVECHGERTRGHRVRRDLVDRQAAALGYPVRFVDLPADADNDAYETRMCELAREYADRADAVAFADLHLDDVRAYRESVYADAPLETRFPLWGRDPDPLVETVLDRFEAVVVAASDALGPAFAGRRLDAEFRADLPDGVDPCGESGEFHTFVVDGPPFDERVPVEVGEPFTDERHGTTLHYRDLEPA